MFWIHIFVFQLTVLQNMMAIFAKLPLENSSKSAEVLSHTWLLNSENTPSNDILFDDNDHNAINLQRTNNVEGDHTRKNNRVKGGRRGSAAAGEGKKRRRVQKRKKQTETTKEIEYFENAINSNNNNKQQQSNKNKQTSSRKIKTTTNNMKQQTNLFSDKETMMTKTDAGITMAVLPIRVENDLMRSAETNEVSTKRTENQKTKITNFRKNSIANNNGGATVARGNSVTTTTVQPLASTKLYQSNIFVNPFGQLVAFFGNDQLHLQDYTFFFNAERHTVFQLHTNNINTNHNSNNNKNVNFSAKASNNAVPALSFAEGGRLLNAVFGGTLIATTTPATTAYNSSPIKVEDVQLYNATSLRQSRYNPFNPTRILIHGWFGGATAGVYQTLIPAYLRQGTGNYNVFTVDWGRGAVADYLTASYRVKPVGKIVAKFIDFLHREAGMRFEDLHVIGFSMGAHIAGTAGKHIQAGRLPVIYALDPALPFFRYENYDDRIAITDADYVEVVHTSVGSYGYDRPLGHVDFYVNFGNAQPGCFFNECSHMRAYQIFAESLQTKNAFRAQGCDVKLWSDMIKYRKCSMGTGRQMILGADSANVTALRGRGGVFYLITNSVPPYAKEMT